jgi:hypothetical protein
MRRNAWGGTVDRCVGYLHTSQRGDIKTNFAAFDLGQAMIANLNLSMILLLFSFAVQPNALLVQEILFVDTVRSKVTSWWQPLNDLQTQPGFLHAYERTRYMYTLTKEEESTMRYSSISLSR